MTPNFLAPRSIIALARMMSFLLMGPMLMEDTGICERAARLSEQAMSLLVDGGHQQKLACKGAGKGQAKGNTQCKFDLHPILKGAAS